jgi:UDP-N-acetylmuramate dehydrogenase
MDLRRDVPLAPLTTLGVGGPARFFVDANAEKDVPEAVEFAARRKLPLFVLGGGSNLLVADSGFPGVVLHMGIPGVRETAAGEETLVEAGAGEVWDALVARCVERGLAGIECLSGIPGTVGGTPVQNVGAYGQDVAAVIRTVRAFDRVSSAVRDLPASECGFGYRSSAFNTTHAGRYIVLTVTYALIPGGPPGLGYHEVMDRFRPSGAEPSLGDVRAAVRAIRRAKSMLLVPGDPDSRSAGSFFKNPTMSDAEYARLDELAGPDLLRYPASEGRVKVSAAKLIEKAGFARGYRRGGAAISSRHTLALVNRERATAQEILDLAREIRDRVRGRFGVALTPEPVFLGFDEAL